MRSHGNVRVRAIALAAVLVAAGVVTFTPRAHAVAGSPACLRVWASSGTWSAVQCQSDLNAKFTNADMCSNFQAVAGPTDEFGNTTGVGAWDGVGEVDWTGEYDVFQQPDGSCM